MTLQEYTDTLIFLVWWAKIIDTIKILVALACRHPGYLFRIQMPRKTGCKNNFVLSYHLSIYDIMDYNRKENAHFGAWNVKSKKKKNLEIIKKCSYKTPTDHSAMNNHFSYQRTGRDRNIWQTTRFCSSVCWQFAAPFVQKHYFLKLFLHH